MKAPDKRKGGTFHYDKDGKFLRHVPCTKPKADASDTTSETPAAANPAADDTAARRSTGSRRNS